ncbi:3412_t:CDS:2 [Entrophospora sp. SA101]|nr:3412_t:CDS:2 [Entrophospora sp. SA101]
MLKDFVEADEVYLGGKNKNRHWDKKAPKCQGSNAIAQVVPNVKQKTLEPLIRANVKEGRKASTNSAENVNSRLKRGIYGTYYWVKKKNVQRYVNEVIFRFNTRKYSTQDRFDLLLSSAAGKRLTYQQLINGKSYCSSCNIKLHVEKHDKENIAKESELDQMLKTAINTPPLKLKDLKEKLRKEEEEKKRNSEEKKNSNPTERNLILLNLGFFSKGELLTANNLVLAVFPHINNFECQQYLIRQTFEEAVHTDTFIYCCDSLGLEPNEIYNMHLAVPSIAEKDNFVIELTKSISNRKFEIKNGSDIQLFLHDLIGYYVIMEGIFFYAGFAMMLALKRNNKMVGIGQQFEFIMRDESLHLEISELIKKATELEKKYALDACPAGIVGISAEEFSKYVEYIADRRLERIGLPKVTEYQTGGSLE